jgi:hypothetical protein
MRKVSWWQCGLVGGCVPSFATLIKLIRAVAGGAAGGADWGEAAGFAAMIFAIGFACGVVNWMGLGLSRRFGAAGDALVGVAVMVVFFLGCMLVFDPDLLGPKFASGGVPMFGLAVVAGLVLGVWIGHDPRKELAASAPRDGPPDGSEPSTTRSSRSGPGSDRDRHFFD